MRKYEDIGKRLQELRNKKISQENLAKQLNISLPSYQRYESGERAPHPHVVTKIAKMFNTTTDWILTGELNIEKSRITERAKAALYLEEIVEKLEEINRREEKLLYLGVKESAAEYGLERLGENDFIQKLRGYIVDTKIDFLPIEKRKVVESVLEILDSKNTETIEALKAFLKMLQISKNRDENKGGA